MATQPDAGDTSKDELLRLADQLLEEAAEMRKQWADLHKALRGEQPEAPSRRQDTRPQREADADPRRLVAVEMMLAGRSREEVERHLRREFGDDAAEEVLSEVYAD